MGQVCKVYIGSFNADVPLRTDLNPNGAELFEREQGDLLQDLYEIPQRSCDRKARSRSGQHVKPSWWSHLPSVKADPLHDL